MPRAKIDYVVSFSSEDPEHPASNLLSREVSKKKWLCKKGESSCSVVLQLARAIKISGIHIGAHHAALVEVLVVRSETSTDQFQVLVPSSVFVSPSESRKDVPVERVRSFGAAQLAPAAEQRWDRVRVVCSQPYNKHCKYGLSFIHIDEVEGSDSNSLARSSHSTTTTTETKPAIPQRMLTLDTMSSDEDDFKPGELFAKHLQKKNTAEEQTTSTGAQIRQASSQALKNIPDSATKLTKTLINKPITKRDSTIDHKVDRTRDTLLYTEDDEQPHAKIDQLVKRHQDEKEREEKAKPIVVKRDKKDKKDDRTKYEGNTSRHDDNRKGVIPDGRKNENKRNDDRRSYDRKNDDKRNEDRKNDDRRNDDKMIDNRTKYDGNTSKHKDDKNRNELAFTPKRINDAVSETRGHSSNGSSSERKREEIRKRRRSEDTDQGESSEPHTILRGVVLVLSGYENPRRANVRNTALALGAQVARDWGPHCTHLICAFPNTPKMREVRKSRGDNVPVVLAEWVEDCSRRRRLLPWRWYATEPKHKLQKPESPSPERKIQRPISPEPDPDCDTDEEIEKVLQNQKKRRTLISPSPSKPNNSPTSGESPNNIKQSNAPDDSDEKKKSLDTNDDTIVCEDDNLDTSAVQLSPDEDAYDVSTEPETEDENEAGGRGGLPAWLCGRALALDCAEGARAGLARYVRAYGGLLLDGSEAEVDFVVCGEGAAGGAGAGGGRRVSARWLARCHAAGALLPPG